ncbi:MAG: VCBS repeat-containing protein, partial [Patescibacteria group bacterium]|nr:VCBS repeat-containing protein [Patescibacteria group bacterium]
VNVASGDIDGDGISEIITGAGKGGGPHIRVFDIDGNLMFQFFAYDKNFRGGVNVAVGDIDGDGISEIITGAGKGGGPHIRIFDRFGRVLSQFFAYDKNFRGGVNVAVGDIDGDGISEIITGAGKGGGPHIRVFNASGFVKYQFFAYDKEDHHGINVAVGDIDNDGKYEIIASPKKGGGNLVKIFNKQGALVESLNVFSNHFDEGINIAIMSVE